MSTYFFGNTIIAFFLLEGMVMVICLLTIRFAVVIKNGLKCNCLILSECFMKDTNGTCNETGARGCVYML